MVPPHRGPVCSGRDQIAKTKYANTLASLPKQVLRDILDTLDACNDSDEPFDFLKNTLLGQFGKSKWHSYFELLRLPMEMQGLKSSVLMGKLKQHLPLGVSPDNDLFLAMFLIRLLPSMRETEGAGAHKTATAMVKAADALWDARGSHDPTVAAASTQRSRSPTPSSGKRGDKGAVTPIPKVVPLPAQISTLFKTLPMACANFTTTTPIGLTGAFRPVLGRKLLSRRTPFSSAAFPTHATATDMHFPANAGLIFLTDELTNDRYLVDTGATLSIVSCNQNSSPSGPFLKGADGQPIPSWVLLKKLCNFKASFLHQPFCKPLWLASFWALTF